MQGNMREAMHRYKFFHVSVMGLFYCTREPVAFTETQAKPRFLHIIFLEI